MDPRSEIYPSKPFARSLLQVIIPAMLFGRLMPWFVTRLYILTSLVPVIPLGVKLLSVVKISGR